MELYELITEIKTKLQDQASELSASELQNTTVSALAQFSKDRPREIVFDIIGDDSYDYDLPSDWVPGFSVIKDVEYPAGERIPTMLEDEDWEIYKTTSTRKLRLFHHTPSASETVRIKYTTIYLNTTIDNIPAHETDAFSNLAAALCCGLLSRHYGQLGDPDIIADAVDYQNKSAEWSQRGKELMKLYNDYLGKQKGVAAASGIKDLDLDSSNKQDRLTHPQRQR